MQRGPPRAGFSGITDSGEGEGEGMVTELTDSCVIQA